MDFEELRDHVIITKDVKSICKRLYNLNRRAVILMGSLLDVYFFRIEPGNEESYTFRVSRELDSLLAGLNSSYSRLIGNAIGSLADDDTEADDDTGPDDGPTYRDLYDVASSALETLATYVPSLQSHDVSLFRRNCRLLLQMPISPDFYLRDPDHFRTPHSTFLEATCVVLVLTGDPPQ